MLVADGGSIIIKLLTSAKQKMGMKIEDAYEGITKKIPDKINYLIIQVIANMAETEIEGEIFRIVPALLPIIIKYISKN